VFNLTEIIFPSRCIGCTRLGISICSECRKQWHPHIYQREINCNSENFPVLSAIQYSPIASRVLLSAKESQIRAADQLIVNGVVHSLNTFVKRYGSATLVPVPSRKSANRKRGRNFLQEITSQVAAEVGLSSHSLLTHSRKVRDQSRLNIADRSENVSRAFSIAPELTAQLSAGNTGPTIIVIDDLITTGATLSEAIRALRTAGFTVLGAVTSCTAKPLR
jgi:predicted amidophosphoribosyltransferase